MISLYEHNLKLSYVDIFLHCVTKGILMNPF